MQNAMYDAQILAFQAKGYNRRWWLKVQSAGGDDDRAALTAFLELTKLKLEKVFDSLNDAIEGYLKFDKEERLAFDPDVMGWAEKISKAAGTLETTVELIVKRTTWPKSSRLKSKLESELAEIRRYNLSGVGVQLDAKGGARSVQGVGVLEERRLVTNRTGQSPAQAWAALQSWLLAQKTAKAAKLAYVKAKVEAKLAFVEYEREMAKVSPEYRARNIDWESDAAWEPSQHDAAAFEAFRAKVARQEQK